MNTSKAEEAVKYILDIYEDKYAYVDANYNDPEDRVDKWIGRDKHLYLVTTAKYYMYVVLGEYKRTSEYLINSIRDYNSPYGSKTEAYKEYTDSLKEVTDLLCSRFYCYLKTEDSFDYEPILNKFNAILDTPIQLD